jgi:hypothetical protein
LFDYSLLVEVTEWRESQEYKWGEFGVDLEGAGGEREAVGGKGCRSS